MVKTDLHATEDTAGSKLLGVHAICCPWSDPDGAPKRLKVNFGPDTMLNSYR